MMSRRVLPALLSGLAALLPIAAGAQAPQILRIHAADAGTRERLGTMFGHIAFDRRTGIATVLSGRSSITGRTEVVTLYTAQVRGGGLFFVATVSPEEDSYRYSSVFRNMVSSIQLND